MKKLICKILGHIKTGKQYSYFDFGDGTETWGTICPRCQKLLMCQKGNIPSDESYITCIELSGQSEKDRQELLSYPRLLTPTASK